MYVCISYCGDAVLSSSQLESWQLCLLLNAMSFITIVFIKGKSSHTSPPLSAPSLSCGVSTVHFSSWVRVGTWLPWHTIGLTDLFAFEWDRWKMGCVDVCGVRGWGCYPSAFLHFLLTSAIIVSSGRTQALKDMMLFSSPKLEDVIPHVGTVWKMTELLNLRLLWSPRSRRTSDPCFSQLFLHHLQKGS